MAWIDNLLEEEGGYVGAGDCESALRQMPGDDASAVCGWAVEKARRADDGPGEVGLGHFVFAVAAVDGDVVEEGVGHDIDH